MAVRRRKKVIRKKMSIRRKIKKARVVAGKKSLKSRRLSQKGTTIPVKAVTANHETLAESAKYYPPQPQAPARAYPDLPVKYGRDMLVLQVRDPWWIHSYWELKDRTLERLRRELKDDFAKAKRVLRVYDISFIDFNGSNAHRFFDILLNDHADNWYIDTGSPGRSWCADLGLLLADGRFITILRSNTVQTPLDGPSWITDEEWMIPDDLFAKLYGVGVGLGSSPMKGKKPWKVHLRGGISSGSPVRKK